MGDAKAGNVAIAERVTVRMKVILPSGDLAVFDVHERHMETRDTVVRCGRRIAAQIGGVWYCSILMMRCSSSQMHAHDGLDFSFAAQL